jgi:hypothetical protein
MTTPTLNTDLIDQIVDHIRPTNFYMGSWSNADDADHAECGTTCCIAGWARVLSSKNPKRMLVTVARDNNNDRIANKKLGLAPTTATTAPRHPCSTSRTGRGRIGTRTAFVERRSSCAT